MTTPLVAPVTLVWLRPQTVGDASPPERAPELPVAGSRTLAQTTIAPLPKHSVRALETDGRDSASAPQAAATPQPTSAPVAGVESGGSEPLEPAYLAGEPLIKLGDDEALNGSIALRLSIDDTGHVVDSRLSAQEGLPESAVSILVRAFTGYVYVPARRGGRPVRSDVTMVIAVRDGHGVSRQSP